MTKVRVPQLNRVQLAGRLTRDPELKYLGDGTPLCKIGIAVNERIKKGDEWKTETQFFDCTAWRTAAERLAEQWFNGRPIIIDGKLKTRTWEDGETKKERKATEISIMQFYAIDWPDEKDKTPKPEAMRAQEEQRPAEDEGYEDDLPF